MQTVSPEAQTVFDANRAVGHIALSVVAENGVTRRRDVHESGPARVRFPNAGPHELEAVTVNTAGGIAGGDAFTTEILVGPGAALNVSTAAAEKIYRSTGADAHLTVKLQVDAGAHLAWLPQETIMFDRARLSRRIDVELAPDASLVLAEALVFGRSAMGEAVEEGTVTDRWRVRRGGRLVFAETMKLSGEVSRKLSVAAIARGACAVATVLIAPANDARIESLRALDLKFAGEAGISAWNGIAVARFCAPDGAALRHDLISVLVALKVGLPRLWLQ